MAKNYTPTATPGADYLRPWQVVITHELGSTPIATFAVQSVFNKTDGTKLLTSAQQVDFGYDAAKIIPIIDMTTGIATGETITHAQLHGYINSMYVQETLERDARDLLTVTIPSDTV